ncbi:MAG: sodium:solute symporter [Lachnospiraceae bacterium]|nr:sodium:solute symporter [Lachnospiraceae bacterium]
MAIKIIMLALFFSIFIVVGISCRKASTDVNGFVLGGRKVGPWLTAFAYGTSYFSAVIFVGYAGQFGWTFGISSTWIGLGNAAIGSLLAWVILGRRTRIMTQHLGSKTMPDFFGQRYDCNKLKVVASAITFLFLIPYTASLFNGLSRLFKMAFNVDYAVCVIVMAVLTAIYVIVGGYMATAVNDFIQGLIMLVGIIAVILAVLSKHGGLMGSMAELAKVESPVMTGAYASFLGPEPFYLLVVVLLTSLGTWGLPQMVGKFYAINNEESVKKGTIISTIFAVIVAGGCYFLGGFGRIFTDDKTVLKEGFDSIVPTMLSGLPDILIAVVLILVLSASMSTLSSLVLASSSTLTLDFIGPLTKKDMDEKKKMLILRIFVAVFIIISAAIAIVQAKSRVTFIAQLMGISWGALSGAFLAPFMYGLYSKKVTRASVWVSFIFGVSIMIVQLLVSLGVLTVSGPVLTFIFRNSLYSGVFSMLFSLILVPVVSALTQGTKPKDVDNMFTCYDRFVKVHATTSLEDE